MQALNYVILFYQVNIAISIIWNLDFYMINVFYGWISYNSFLEFCYLFSDFPSERFGTHD